MSADPQTPAVYYDVASGALFIGPLRTSDKAVIREASRWATGERGDPVDDLAALAGADLSTFAREALSIGARVLAIASQSNDTLAVQQAVRAATDQVTDAARLVSQNTDDAVRKAADAIGRSTREAHENVMTQVTRLVGGDNPELMERIRPLMAQVGKDLERQVVDGLNAATNDLRATGEKRHEELVTLVRDVRQEVAVRVAEQAAAEAVKAGTTIKGFDFEAQLHAVFTEIAAGLGDDYRETGEIAGALPRNKKGDGVIDIDGGVARIVIEAHDGSSKDWGPYLAEAERNRRANTSIGVVKHLRDNSDRTVRVIGPKRIIVAFDPAVDDIEVLRTVVLLMRTVALSSSGRFGTEALVVVNEHIREAVTAVEELNEAKRSANAIAGHVEKIDRTITRAAASIQRELHGALNALQGTDDKAVDQASDRVRDELDDRQQTPGITGPDTGPGDVLGITARESIQAVPDPEEGVA